MKKSELKRILKPLVTECIKESLMEDGLISGIIAEVVRGMNTPQTIVEAKQPQVDPQMNRMKRNAFDGEQRTKLKEHKKKLGKRVQQAGERSSGKAPSQRGECTCFFLAHGTYFESGRNLSVQGK